MAWIRFANRDCRDALGALRLGFVGAWCRSKPFWPKRFTLLLGGAGVCLRFVYVTMFLFFFSFETLLLKELSNDNVPVSSH